MTDWLKRACASTAVDGLCPWGTSGSPSPIQIDGSSTVYPSRRPWPRNFRTQGARCR